ncbi:protein fuzzy homolog [Bradysia coprophila]|uniref:protein fuzzy homolog n=1 Tax=Bradysia coprophila TaxID=38358 RepID=UPI00187DB6EA|nr:protein fuzzy homolog [Bradysia coprophila]
MINIMCLTSSGGLPIFNRKRGDCENLPFATIGSLNGVHMFCKSQGVNIRTTYMDDGVIVWREFENCVTMIGAAKGITEDVLNNLLEYAFNAMIFCVSLSELKHNKNVEQLKRELKSYFPILDKLLESAETDFLKFSDCILTNENAQILLRLNEFSDQIGSPFCTVLLHHKILVGTEGWWDLDVVDRKLLITTIQSSNKPFPDVPVYLPKKNPNIAYRFVCVAIRQNISVCVLCGAEPQYADIENLARQIWKNDNTTMENAELTYPRNLPIDLKLDQGILGLILINKLHSKYVMTRNLQQSSNGKRTTAGAHRLDILRTFFHQAVDTINKFLETPSEQNGKIVTSLESYWCSDYHKCHAYAFEDNLICVLYVAAIPTHNMRIITQKTLNLIIAEKDISW